MLRDLPSVPVLEDDAEPRLRAVGGPVNEPHEHSPRRSAGYSQAVRFPCQFRLVQIIPLRPLTLSICLAVCTVICVVLIAGHHWAIQNLGEQWQTNPLGRLLDLRSRNSFSGWLTTQLWMFLAIGCLFVFQLRRHKLDDYRARYRIWLWIVPLCLAGSVDSLTGWTVLTSYALDLTSRVYFGWSGPAVLIAVCAVSMLLIGTRLAGELKVLTSSLIAWCVGLIVWGVSLALVSGIFKHGISEANVDLIVGATWLVGQMLVAVSTLLFLRHNYIEAQRRFMLRDGRLSATQFSMPQIRIPKVQMRWRRGKSAEELAAEEAAAAQPKKRRRKAVANPGEVAEGMSAKSLDAPASLRPAIAERSSTKSASGTAEEAPVRRSWFGRSGKDSQADRSNRDQAAETANRGESHGKELPPLGKANKFRLGSFRFGGRKKAGADTGQENRSTQEGLDTKSNDRPSRLTREEKRAIAAEKRALAEMQREEKRLAKRERQDSEPRRSWIPKMSLPKVRVPKVSIPKLSLPKLGRKAVTADGEEEPSEAPAKPRVMASTLPMGQSATTKSASNLDSSSRGNFAAARPAPAPVKPQVYSGDADDDDEEGASGFPTDRRLSKAERRRLKRQQNDGEQRAA